MLVSALLSAPALIARAPSTITYTQCLTTLSTTTLKTVGHNGYPCVTPLKPWKANP